MRLSITISRRLSAGLSNIRFPRSWGAPPQLSASCIWMHELRIHQMSIVCLGLALRLRRRRLRAFLINHSKGSLAGNVSRPRHPRIESLTRRRRLLAVRGVLVLVDMEGEKEQEEVGLAHSDAHPRHRTCLARWASWVSALSILN